MHKLTCHMCYDYATYNIYLVYYANMSMYLSIYVPSDQSFYMLSAYAIFFLIYAKIFIAKHTFCRVYPGAMNKTLQYVLKVAMCYSQAFTRRPAKGWLSQYNTITTTKDC